MNCDNCQNLMSAFLDGDLDKDTSVEMRTHFSLCAECSKLKEDFSSILGFCDETFAEDSVPPNSQALWCRINNIIESEVEVQNLAEESRLERPSWFKQAWNARIQFSPTQMVSSFLGIALISSLLTIVGIKNFSAPQGEETVAEPGLIETGLAKIGVIDSPEQKLQKKLQQRKSAINYWKKRVEARKTFWNARMRTTFDRNLKVIDTTVSEYTNILQKDPQDSISSEMLDSALNEKMELLREFSEL